MAKQVMWTPSAEPSKPSKPRKLPKLLLIIGAACAALLVIGGLAGGNKPETVGAVAPQASQATSAAPKPSQATPTPSQTTSVAPAATPTPSRATSAAPKPSQAASAPASVAPPAPTGKQVIAQLDCQTVIPREEWLPETADTKKLLIDSFGCQTGEDANSLVMGVKLADHEAAKVYDQTLTQTSNGKYLTMPVHEWVIMAYDIDALRFASGEISTLYGE